MKKRLQALTLDDIENFKEDFTEELCELCQDFEKVTGTSINGIDLLREYDDDSDIDVIVGADMDILLNI